MEAAFDEDDGDGGAAVESTPSNGAAAFDNAGVVVVDHPSPDRPSLVELHVVLPPSGDDDDDFNAEVAPRRDPGRGRPNGVPPKLHRRGGGRRGDVYINGINVVTGELIENEQRSAAGTWRARRRIRGRRARVRSYQGLELSKDEINRIKGEERAAMLSARKLVLVLDLDHTLLNSATVHEMTPTALKALEVRYAEAARAAADPGAAPDDAAADRRALAAATAETGLHVLPHIGMWTKLRPGLAAFLAAAAERYELYVYTMGARRYAWEMASLIDPLGTYGLMQDRVIAKEDSTWSTIKSLDVVLGSEETVVIVDDTLAVWQRYADQVLVPRRYHFFDSSAQRPPPFRVRRHGAEDAGGDAGGARRGGGGSGGGGGGAAGRPLGVAVARGGGYPARAPVARARADPRQLLRRARRRQRRRRRPAARAQGGGGGAAAHPRRRHGALHRSDHCTRGSRGEAPRVAARRRPRRQGRHRRRPLRHPRRRRARRHRQGALGPRRGGRARRDVRVARAAATSGATSTSAATSAAGAGKGRPDRGARGRAAAADPERGTSSAAAPGLLTSAADVAARIALGGSGDDDWLEGSGEEEEELNKAVTKQVRE